MSEATFNQRGGATSGADASNGLSPSMVRRAIFASVLGNGLEWFDFLIYGCRCRAECRRSAAR
jgi:MHS family proline/betaine transporter-like MFS transporter